MMLRTIGIACLAVGALYGADTAASRLQEAHEVFMEIMDAPDKGIPQDLLGKALGIRAADVRLELGTTTRDKVLSVPRGAGPALARLLK